MFRFFWGHRTFKNLVGYRGGCRLNRGLSVQGRIQDFKLGGAHLKKMHRTEGGAKIFGVFRVKNPILGGGAMGKRVFVNL